MIVRVLVVFLFIHKVSPLYIKVEGVVGGSVVLPCSAKAEPSSKEDINVHWRHNESMEVYDIIKGVGSVERQKQEYKNRIGTFSEEYLKGNFSLQLNNLKNTDAGMYSCFITKGSVLWEVKLIVKDFVEKPEDNKNQGAQTGPEKIVTMSLLSFSILLFI